MISAGSTVVYAERCGCEMTACAAGDGPGAPSSAHACSVAWSSACGVMPYGMPPCGLRTLNHQYSKLFFGQLRSPLSCAAARRRTVEVLIGPAFGSADDVLASPSASDWKKTESSESTPLPGRIERKPMSRQCESGRLSLMRVGWLSTRPHLYGFFDDTPRC